MAVNRLCTHVVTRQNAEDAPSAFSEGFCTVCRVQLAQTQDKPWCSCCGFVWTERLAAALADVYVEDGPLLIRPLAIARETI